MVKKNKIIVTGGAGFVGTNLIKLLLKKTNYKIISIDMIFFTFLNIPTNKLLKSIKMPLNMLLLKI